MNIVMCCICAYRTNYKQRPYYSHTWQKGATIQSPGGGGGGIPINNFERTLREINNLLQRIDIYKHVIKFTYLFIYIFILFI